MNTQIKAEELRIGNYLERNGLMQVTAIHKAKIKIYDHFNKKEHEYFFLASTFKGLPITEEMLLKAGFEKTGVSFFIAIEATHAIQESLEMSPNNDADGLWYVYMRQGDNKERDKYHLHDLVLLTNKLMYINQLQNLYFALTGKELTI